MLGDVRNNADLEKAMAGVEAVYHFAAYQDYLPDLSTFFHVNSVSTALLYEIAVEKKIDLAKVLVASSQFVQGEGLYACPVCGERTGGAMRPESQLKKGDWGHHCPKCGENMEWQWTSEDHADPPNAYAMSKYSQELQAITFGKRYGIPSVALRYSIVQGPRQSFYNAYSGACRIFSLSYYFGKAPTVYEDGKQCRDFVNIHDVVRANMMALEDERMNYGVFNVGGGMPYTVLEFAEIVRREVQARSPQLKTQRVSGSAGQGLHGQDVNKGELTKAKVPGLYRFGDTRNACSDISKLKKLGWTPRNSPVESVREYVDWLFAQDNVEDILKYAEKTMEKLGVVRKIVRHN